MKIVLIAGARPNFMKVAPILRALRARGGFTPFLVHTGQHYDAGLSRVFFSDLGLPEPDAHLGVGSGSHAQQTARVMSSLEPVLEREAPDWTLVVGDVNSTVAAALTAVKMGLRAAHVEAGLRSGDRSMPEEINRLATDAICDLLLTPSRDADENLRREGHPESRIAFVGNTMVDSLLQFLPRVDAEAARRAHGIDGDYVLVTLHRPGNVDDPAVLGPLAGALAALAAELPVLFPVHPRTRPLLDRVLSPAARPGSFRLTDPAGYLEFLALEKGARLVVTDSGGVQEETTVLGVPCLTVRPQTERPITVSEGTNRVIGNSPVSLLREARAALAAPRPTARRPEGWDGHAGERIVERLLEAARA